MLCREQVAQLRDANSHLVERGVEVVVVGNGKPHHAKMFAEDESVPFTLWVDPEMNAYRAAGLQRGVTKVFTRKGLGHSMRAFKGGFRQKKTQGDPWQNGGVFVITPQGESLMEQVSQEAGDHAQISDILQAIDRGASA